MQPSMIGEEKFALVSCSLRSLVLPFLIFTLGGGVLGGCVSSEKYEAEKARSLNFQRLLAQEEKRTGELNVKFQDAQRKVSDLESQNRDLNTEMAALREQLDRTQAELTRAREGGPSAEAAPSDDLTLSEPSISEFGLEDMDFPDTELADLGGDLGGDLGNDLGPGLGDDTGAGLGGETKESLGGDMGGDMGTDMGADLGLEPDLSMAAEPATYHTVSRGETLYGISRQYGVRVQDLKDWNNLTSDLILVGQKLVVSGP